MVTKVPPEVYQLMIRIFLASLVIALYCSILFIVPKIDVVNSDFASFLTGAAVIKEGHGNKLYDMETQRFYHLKIVEDYPNKGLLPFRNLPFFAALFIPLTFLPLTLAFKLYALFVVEVLIFITILLAKIFRKVASYPFWPLIPFLFFPSLFSITLGQTTPLVLLFFLLIYKLFKTNKLFSAGVISGLLLLKPQYFIAVPFLLFLGKDRKKFPIGVLSAALIIFLVNVAISGPDFVSHYLDFLMSTESSSFGSRPWLMFTLFSVLRYLPGFAEFSLTSLLGINTLLYLLALYFFIRRVGQVSFNSAFASIILLTVVFSIHALTHDLIVLLIPIFILLSALYGERVKRTRVLITGITATLFIFPLLSFVFFPERVFLFSFLLLAIALFLLLRDSVCLKGEVGQEFI